MAGQRELSILGGLVDGLNKRAENIRSLRTAKEKLEQQKKSFDINMKIDNLKLEELQNDPMRDKSVLKGKAELLKSKQQVEKADFDFKFKTLEQVHDTAMQEIKNKKMEADIVAESYKRIKEGEIAQSQYAIKDGGVNVGGGVTDASKSKQFDIDFDNAINEVTENPENAEIIKNNLKRTHARRWSLTHEMNFDDVVKEAERNKKIKPTAKFKDKSAKRVSAEKRFNELISEGHEEEEVYQMLKREGY